MPETVGNDPAPPEAANKAFVSNGAGPLDSSRRLFLKFFPAGIFVGMAATLAVVSLRFLRPASALDEAAANTGAGQWATLAPLADLSGAEPLPRRLVLRREAGWLLERETHEVFVLPQPAGGFRAVSAACPHEGCAVEWRTEEHQFFCPCHDSRFDPAGGRLSGPAARGLDPLPTRIAGGTLQVQYQTPGREGSHAIPPNREA